VSDLSAAERRELYELLKIREQRARENTLAGYAPYAKQREFHSKGHDRERLFLAGNQLGKTWAGAYEVAMHLTGRYPDWWAGRRWGHGISVMAGSESTELTRGGVQRLLVGRPEDESQWGTGTIPRECILSTSRRQGVANAIDSVVVKHVSGETSVLQLKSYDQGRSKWQADTVDLVWFDEEPPEALYFEGLTRTNATSGSVFVTFTPLLGMSSVVKRFLLDKPAGTSVTSMTIDDAPHYTAEQRAAIIAQYPDHERDARARGIPMLGSGRVFPVSEEAIKISPFQIPAYWPRICGLDFGWDHPTAAAWLAWDRDTDAVYLYDAYRAKEQPVVMHAAAIRQRADWIPVAWPHDGLQHDKGSGEQLAKQYKDQGVSMLSARTTFEDGSNGVEAGIAMMLTRMQAKTLRVFSHLDDWFSEFRMYHRKDGRLVKLDDDLISATRYGLMSLRHARTQLETEIRPSRRAPLPVVSFNVLDPMAGY